MCTLQERGTVVRGEGEIHTQQERNIDREQERAVHTEYIHEAGEIPPPPPFPMLEETVLHLEGKSMHYTGS